MMQFCVILFLLYVVNGLTPPNLRGDMFDGDIRYLPHPRNNSRVLDSIIESQTWRRYRVDGIYEIPYDFDETGNDGDSDYENKISSAEMEQVISSIEYLNQRMRSLRLVRREEESHPHYVNIGKFVGGCWSWVGDVSARSSPQMLNLDDGCYTRGVVVHELIHSIGFVHEQSRIDRDEYVEINFDNINQLNHNQFAIVDGIINNTVRYDYRSIMHYSQFAMAIDKTKPSITTKDRRFQNIIGEGEEPSKVDIFQIELLYRCVSGVRDYTEFCTSECPCFHYEGWCSSDADCVDDLRCGPSNITNPDNLIDNPPFVCLTQSEIDSGVFQPTLQPTTSPTPQPTPLINRIGDFGGDTMWIMIVVGGSVGVSGLLAYFSNGPFSA